MSTKASPVTADDLLLLHVPGKRFELIKGELAEMTPAGGRHGQVASRFDRRLGTFVEQAGLGEVVTSDAGFWIERDPDTVRAPDVAFIRKSKLPPDGVLPTKFLDVVPDLVVEVISPSDSATGVQSKVEEWLRAGVLMVLVAYPDPRSIVIHDAAGRGRVLFENDTLDTAPVIPGFTCKVNEFF